MTMYDPERLIGAAVGAWNEIGREYGPADIEALRRSLANAADTESVRSVQETAPPQTEEQINNILRRANFQPRYITSLKPSRRNV